MFVVATGVISDPCVSEHFCCLEGLLDSGWGEVGGASYVVFWLFHDSYVVVWLLPETWTMLVLLVRTCTVAFDGFPTSASVVFWWSTWFFVFVT